MGQDGPDNALERRWKAATKAIFGKEAEGDLKDYGDWLALDCGTVQKRKSCISGKEVLFAIKNYCDGARCISLDEAGAGIAPEPLEIGELQDFDSLVGAVRERACYAGSVVLGNCSEVQGSANISNSHYVLCSTFVSDSKYVAYSTLARYSESIFGTNNDSNSSFLIRGLETTDIQRGFEFLASGFCADSLYCFGLDSCNDCMFSFNLRGKRHMIGNRQLSREDYLRVKNTLLEQMADELAAKKSLPTLLQLVGGKAPEIGSGKLQAIASKAADDDGQWGPEPVEAAFTKATKIVLGKPLPGIRRYRGWLMENVRGLSEAESIASKKKIAVGDYVPFNMLPKNRLLCRNEAIAAGEELKLGEKEVAEISLKNAPKLLGNVAMFTTEVRRLENRNVHNATLARNARDCCDGSIFANTKFSAFSFWPRDSESVFGVDTAFSCSFCIKCYHSDNLARCFQCAACPSCRGYYFSHTG